MVILICKLCKNLQLEKALHPAYPARCPKCEKDLELYQCEIAYAENIPLNKEE